MPRLCVSSIANFNTILFGFVKKTQVALSYVYMIAYIYEHKSDILTNIELPQEYITKDYLTLHLPQASTHQIYFDYGTATLDAIYEPYQLQINQIFQGNASS